MARSLTSRIEYPLEKDGKRINLVIFGRGYEDQGRRSGHPDNWTESEGSMNIESIEDEDGSEWEGELPFKDYKIILQKLWANARTADDFEPLDDFDFDF